jgi:hypothetical protein
MPFNILLLPCPLSRGNVEVAGGEAMEWDQQPSPQPAPRPAPSPGNSKSRAVYPAPSSAAAAAAAPPASHSSGGAFYSASNHSSNGGSSSILNSFGPAGSQSQTQAQMQQNPAFPSSASSQQQQAAANAAALQVCERERRKGSGNAPGVNSVKVKDGVHSSSSTHLPTPLLSPPSTGYALHRGPPLLLRPALPAGAPSPRVPSGHEGGPRSLHGRAQEWVV